MIVYHGSNVIASEPRLIQQNRFLDFGFGFYTTTNKTQAIGFAEKVTRRRKKRGSIMCPTIVPEIISAKRMTLFSDRWQTMMCIRPLLCILLVFSPRSRR